MPALALQGLTLERIRNAGLGDHPDVNLTGLTPNDLIAWDGSDWVPASSAPPASHALTFHSDVIITTPSVGEVLRYDGGNWVNAVIARADIPSAIAYEDEANFFTQDQDFGGKILLNILTVKTIGNTPGIRFEDTGTPRTWNMGVNGTTGYIFITDVTAALNRFRINVGGDADFRSNAVAMGQLSTSATGLVTNLNADLLDGSHASAFALASHTHVKADITDTPWAWTDVSKTGSSLADLATRSAADLSSGILLNARLSGVYSSVTGLGVQAQALDMGTNNIGNVGTLVTSGDVTIGSLGVFDSTSAPSTDHILRYDGSKWISAFLHTQFLADDGVSQINGDSTTSAFVYSSPTLSGAPTPNPSVAPIVTAFHKSILIDMSAYTLGATEAFVLDYSVDGGAYTTAAIITTGTNVIHATLASGSTYAYKYKIRGASDTPYSPASSALNPLNDSSSIAFGTVLAANIVATNLAAISADIGDVSAGQIRNAANTKGVLLSGTRPGGWTDYVDFTATGNNAFLKHAALTLEADGDATFSGVVAATQFTANIITIGDATASHELRFDGLSGDQSLLVFRVAPGLTTDASFSYHRGNDKFTFALPGTQRVTIDANGIYVGTTGGGVAPSGGMKTEGNIESLGVFIGSGASLTTLNASNLSSGTLANARVTAGNVTQHVGSINHDALLNFLASEHFTQAAITTVGALSSGSITNFGAINIGISALTCGTITSSGIVKAAAGAVGGPAFSFALDLDTGMWNPTTNRCSIATGGTERLRIDSDGRIYDLSLSVSSDVQTDSGGAFSTASDSRLKTPTRIIGNATSMLNLLTPRYYKWNDDIGTVRESEHLGFFAQELNAVIPQAAPRGLDRTGREQWGHNVRALAAVLVKGFQELDSRVVQLEAA